MSEHAASTGKFLYMDNGFCQTSALHTDRTEPSDLLTEEQALRLLFDALSEAEMDPLMQLMGYLTSDDPSYLPENKGARAIISKVGRDRLLRHLLQTYLEKDMPHAMGDPL